ncbi:MAG: hypothetical protein ACLGSD_13345 [Acidobacteriota bacterium]
MIRQAISCDICGAEKKQTNHWFVACEQGGEMRVSGWNSRNRLRAGSKHLCGQTCLHKLLDEFLARTVEGRPASDAATEKDDRSEAVLAMKESLDVEESSARLVPMAAPPERTAPAPVATLPLRPVEAPRPIVLPRIEESAADAARRRRAEAWERERARELRVVERRPN